MACGDEVSTTAVRGRWLARGGVSGLRAPGRQSIRGHRDSRVRDLLGAHSEGGAIGAAVVAGAQLDHLGEAERPLLARLRAKCLPVRPDMGG